MHLVFCKKGTVYKIYMHFVLINFTSKRTNFMIQGHNIWVRQGVFSKSVSLGLCGEGGKWHAGDASGAVPSQCSPPTLSVTPRPLATLAASPCDHVRLGESHFTDWKFRDNWDSSFNLLGCEGPTGSLLARSLWPRAHLWHSHPSHTVLGVTLRDTKVLWSARFGCVTLQPEIMLKMGPYLQQD